jgi:RimJ/RimL family protein N-acetyltransferase
MNLLIRPVKVEDAYAFLNLCNEIDESGWMLYEPGERKTTVAEQEKQLEKIIAQQNSIILVCEEKEVLIGYIGAFGGTVNRTRHGAYLVLGVSSRHRGKGVASQLFKRLFNWAKEKQLTRLELTAIKENSKAVNLYKKMGFVIEGDRKHSLMIEGEPVDEYCFYKLL